MAFYYVRSTPTFVGTATLDAGRETVERTGAWDTDVSKSYPSLLSIFDQQAVTLNTLVDEDTIVVASDHVETYTTAEDLNIKTATNYLYCVVESRNVSDTTQYLKGAKVEVTSGALTYGSNNNGKNFIITRGLTLSTNNWLYFHSSSSRMMFLDCDIVAGQRINQNYMHFRECNITCPQMQMGANATAIDCTINTSDSGEIFNLCNATYTRCIFTASASLSNVLARPSTVKLYSCLFPSYTSDFFNVSKDNQETFEGSSSGLSGEYYSYRRRFWEGEVSTNTSVYLNYKYDGVAGASTKLESLDSHRGNPLLHKLCEIPAQNLASSDTTYRVNLLLDVATAASLTDMDFWIDLAHNDNTTLIPFAKSTSRSSDILSTGTTLTTSAETWLGTLPVSSQAYQVDITLSAASLTNVTNGTVTVYVNLALTNVDVYVCPAVQIEQV